VKSCKKTPVARLNCSLSDRSKNEKDLSRIPEKGSWIFYRASTVLYYLAGKHVRDFRLILLFDLGYV